jgi:hypothetical protein
VVRRRLGSVLRSAGVVAGPILFAVGVFSSARDIASLGLPSWGWEALGGALFIVAGGLLYRDRGNAIRDLEARLAAEPQPLPVVVARRDPLPIGAAVLFRLDVHNVGDRRGEFSSEVVAIEGTTKHGPESPYPVHWTEPIKPGHCSIPAGSLRRIDLAMGARVDAKSARSTELERWSTTWVLCVGTEHGRRDDPTPLDGMLKADDLLDLELQLTIRVLHEGTDTEVARKKIRLWYIERDGAFVPQMSEPADA